VSEWCGRQARGRGVVGAGGGSGRGRGVVGAGGGAAAAAVLRREALGGPPFVLRGVSGARFMVR
jgi:hypothetical protein